MMEIIKISDIKNILTNFFIEKLKNKKVKAYIKPSFFGNKVKILHFKKNKRCIEFWFIPIKIEVYSNYCYAYGSSYYLKLYYDPDKFIEYEINYIENLYNIEINNI